MPHVFIERGQYELIPRMTEIISVLECEQKANLHPVHTGSKTWKAMSNYVALKGTLVHHKVENHERETIDMQPIPLELTAGDRQLYNEILGNKEALNWINTEIERCWQNFLQWEKDFRPTYLVPGQSMVYAHYEGDKLIHKKSAKGTVDLICEIDPEQMSDKAFDMFPIDDISTVMLDWKSGSSKQPIHHAQLEGYHWLLNVTGKWEEMARQGIIKHEFAHMTTETGRSYPVGLCILLGGKKYKAIPYDLTEGLFVKAREMFLDPQPIVRSVIRWNNKEFREGYHCVFCTYRDDGCHIFNVVPQLFTTEGVVDFLMVNEDEHEVCDHGVWLGRGCNECPKMDD